MVPWHHGIAAPSTHGVIVMGERLLKKLHVGAFKASCKICGSLFKRFSVKILRSVPDQRHFLCILCICIII